MNKESDIINYYKQHGFQNTQNTFKLTESKLKNLLKDNNVAIRSRVDAYKHRGNVATNLYQKQLKDRIDIKELYDFYKYNSIEKTCRKFKTSNHYIYQLLDENNLKHLTNTDRKFFRYLKNISKEYLLNLFNTYTSIEKLTSDLHISRGMLNRIADYYGIKIPKYKYLDVDKTTLEDLYCEKRLSATEICKSLHISPQRLRILLDEYNLTRATGVFINNHDTTPNLLFEELLKKSNIIFEKEFRIYYDNSNRYKFFSYDFKVKNYLIEINPSVTHNVTKGIRNGKAPIKDKYYHQHKSKVAYKNNYRCIHVWDWDDMNEIVDNILKVNYNSNVSFGEPRKHVYDLNLRRCVNAENINTVTIYDDGLIEE